MRGDMVSGWKREWGRGRGKEVSRGGGGGGL